MYPYAQMGCLQIYLTGSDISRLLPASVIATHGGEIKEGQEMMSGGKLRAFKSALKDGDSKGSTFLVRWSQAGVFISKGE